MSTPIVELKSVGKHFRAADGSARAVLQGVERVVRDPRDVAPRRGGDGCADPQGQLDDVLHRSEGDHALVILLLVF